MNSFKRLNHVLSTRGCAGTPSTRVRASQCSASPLVPNSASNTGPRLPVTTTEILTCKDAHAGVAYVCAGTGGSSSAIQFGTRDCSKEAESCCARLWVALCLFLYPFSSKDPIHNVIYCRKLYIHCLLKLLERKTEAVLIRVEPKNSVFSPQKLKKKTKKKTRSGFTQVVENYSPGN